MHVPDCVVDVPAYEDLVLVLVTRGFEDVCVDYMVDSIGIELERISLLPEPAVLACGDAAVAKMVVRVDTRDTEAHSSAITALQRCPVVQATFAFVAAADGLQTGGRGRNADKPVKKAKKQLAREAQRWQARQKWQARQRELAVSTGTGEGEGDSPS